MEEILASIRRIIADDQAGKASPAPSAEPAPQAKVPAAAAPQPVASQAAHSNDDDVLDLQPKAAQPARNQEPHYIADDPVGNDLSFEDPAPVVEVPVAPPPAANAQDDIDTMMAEMEFAPAPAEQAAPVERLVSPATDRMVSSAFGSLANTILNKNARTLEDLMQDMMRPMIKDWLDDHLPLIVERLVRAEIERVARGGR
jgi:hypothetical protein